MGELSVPQDSRFRQSLALRRGRNFPRPGEHLDAPVFVVTLKSCSDPLRVLGGTDCRGKDLEPGRQHALPVNSNFPWAALVGEEKRMSSAHASIWLNILKDNFEGLGIFCAVEDDMNRKLTGKVAL